MKMKILTFPLEKCKKKGLIFNTTGEKAMNIPKAINPSDYQGIVFFTGAGMSAESGVPTYRGTGGIWHKYNWQEYACQEAFDRDPQAVLKFHELRRKSVLDCQPHAGYFVLAELEQRHPNVRIVTQNIDGMHRRAGSKNITELHGSLWRLRCREHGLTEDIGETCQSYVCGKCGAWLRPDIVWFGDRLDHQVLAQAADIIGACDLFISIGTSGAVWPAAGLPEIAKSKGARCIKINLEPSEQSHIYDEIILSPAGRILPNLFQK